MTRRRCLDCQDDRHCRTGYVPAGTILAPCRCLDCDPQPIQARLFSHALVENDLGGCVDCGQPATKLLVGGAVQPDTSLCEACEYRRYLAATGGRDLANEERTRWGQPPIPRPELALAPSPGGCRCAEGGTPDPCHRDHPARPGVKLEPPQAASHPRAVSAGRRRRPRRNELDAGVCRAGW